MHPANHIHKERVAWPFLGMAHNWAAGSQQFTQQCLQNAAQKLKMPDQAAASLAAQGSSCCSMWYAAEGQRLVLAHTTTTLAALTNANFEPQYKPPPVDRQGSKRQHRVQHCCVTEH